MLAILKFRNGSYPLCSTNASYLDDTDSFHVHQFIAMFDFESYNLPREGVHFRKTVLFYLEQ